MHHIRSTLAAAAIAAISTTQAALAADLSVKAPAPVAMAWSWAGLYAGGHAGAAFGWKDWQSANGALLALQPFGDATMIGGKIAGGQIGYNWQNGTVVWGVELSGSSADVYGDARCARGFDVCHTKVEWLGTATARIGLARDHLLAYVKGGAAALHDKHQITSFDSTSVFEGSKTRLGGVVGAGLEYAFTSDWSAFVEYDYMLFGDKTIGFTDQFGDASGVRIGQDLHLVKFGVNYRPGTGGILGLLGILGVPGIADQSRPAPVLKAPALAAAEWEIEVGARYWYSRGRMKKDLFDPDIPTQLNSRLTYGPSTGHSWEAFARFDHNSGVFLKGYLGIGALVDGTLLDEDFPPTENPYSATHSKMKDGTLRYGALDAGYNLFKGTTWQAGPFVGYRYFFNTVNGYGCRQIATNGDVCVPAFPEAFLGLSETETWRGVAVGLNGQVMLTDRAKLTVDAAYLPYVDRSGFDNHWFRADINPLLEPGRGWGTQIEAILSYAVTSRFNVGIGGRYWHFETNAAHTRFPDEQNTSPMTFWSDRYGGFVQASYKLGPQDLPFDPVLPAPGMTKAPPLPVIAGWAGPYVGVHVGGGWGRKEWRSATGLLDTGANFAAEGDVDGLLAGGQIGFNHQIGKWVLGLEADASWSNYFGNAKCAQLAGTETSFTCNTRIDSLGTITARVGQAYGNVLLYTKAGGAWANDRYDTRSSHDGLVFAGDQTRLGFTLGSGIELAVSPNWSLRAEYDYFWFGDDNVTLTNRVGAAGEQSVVNIEQRLHVVKIGANYRFDWASVPFPK